jgi:hypothetical protein
MQAAGAWINMIVGNDAIESVRGYRQMCAKRVVNGVRAVV